MLLVRALGGTFSRLDWLIEQQPAEQLGQETQQAGGRVRREEYHFGTFRLGHFATATYCSLGSHREASPFAAAPSSGSSAGAICP